MSEFSAQIDVPAAHPCFAGHFPGRPVVPGVLLIDWFVAAVQQRLQQPLRLARLPIVKFLQPVLPGESLRLEWRIEGESTAVNFSATAANGRVAVAGTLAFAPATSLPVNPRVHP